MSLKTDLDKILTRFDEQLACFDTDYVQDEDENGKCLVEVYTINELDYALLKNVYDDLEKLASKIK